MRRCIRAVLALLVAGAVLSSAAPAQGSQADALLRAINRARAANHVAPLRDDGTLARVARRHSRDMVARRYFSHDSPSGQSTVDRIAAAGWMRGRRSWSVGEDLAWFAGSPRARDVVQAWLASPPHRDILLGSAYHVVGLGIASGTPANSGPGATYTADFGS
jgi:uncharacterized protein YkwD